MGTHCSWEQVRVAHLGSAPTNQLVLSIYICEWRWAGGRGVSFRLVALAVPGVTSCSLC